jgi:hypothetical protein
VNFSNHVVNQMLFVKEEINVGWVFPRNPYLQDVNALFNVEQMQN